MTIKVERELLEEINERLNKITGVVKGIQHDRAVNAETVALLELLEKYIADDLTDAIERGWENERAMTEAIGRRVAAHIITLKRFI